MVSWREKMVLRILMTVAELLSPAEWSQEVHNLACHLSVWMPESKESK